MSQVPGGYNMDGSPAGKGGGGGGGKGSGGIAAGSGTGGGPQGGKGGMAGQMGQMAQGGGKGGLQDMLNDGGTGTGAPPGFDPMGQTPQQAPGQGGAEAWSWDKFKQGGGQEIGAGFAAPPGQGPMDGPQQNYAPMDTDMSNMPTMTKEWYEGQQQGPLKTSLDNPNHNRMSPEMEAGRRALDGGGGFSDQVGRGPMPDWAGGKGQKPKPQFDLGGMKPPGGKGASQFNFPGMDSLQARQGGGGKAGAAAAGQNPGGGTVQQKPGGMAFQAPAQNTQWTNTPSPTNNMPTGTWDLGPQGGG